MRSGWINSIYDEQNLKDCGFNLTWRFTAIEIKSTIFANFFIHPKAKLFNFDKAFLQLASDITKNKII